ncbi:Neuroglobin [Trichinella sp. T8]|nr:Neuroglobin [Trichinella sp. T8]
MGCLSSKTDSSDQKSRATLTTDGQSTVPKLDSRLPFQQYRDFFQLKNYWKAVRRREDASKCLFFRFDRYSHGGVLLLALRLAPPCPCPCKAKLYTQARNMSKLGQQLVVATQSPIRAILPAATLQRTHQLDMMSNPLQLTSVDDRFTSSAPGCVIWIVQVKSFSTASKARSLALPLAQSWAVAVLYKEFEKFLENHSTKQRSMREDTFAQTMLPIEQSARVLFGKIIIRSSSSSFGSSTTQMGPCQWTPINTPPLFKDVPPELITRKLLYVNRCKTEIKLSAFLTENAEFHPLYKKLSKVELTEEAAFNSNEFENMANQYLDVFDEAISAIESSPGDVSTAIDELMEVGRKHKAVPNMDASNFSKLESALLYMVQQILLDRFNEKCEDLFKKFFSFVVTNVTKGFNE